ncbi:MAG: hypothetical protein ACRDHZ_16940, partial [Ktedonobacteraceae bacterium]
HVVAGINCVDCHGCALLISCCSLAAAAFSDVSPTRGGACHRSEGPRARSRLFPQGLSLACI